MNCIRKFTVTTGLAAMMVLSAMAQNNANPNDNTKAGVTTAAGAKLAVLPVFPACLTLSAQRGDPFKGPAVILIKMTPGCKVVWHWHSANESLLMISGKGKIEMKDEATTGGPVAPGDYVFLPGKHAHQFSCAAGCTFFDVTEGAFDIHYIDKDGKEIPPEQALKPAKKPAAKSK
ncbi:MAG TPA: cupin domain-containing protein [Candidatus Saccharimonadales bacterium]|jgi:quercetin dioxygenase-like cupin family protein|nr:cupin domain-containing protein [Candidatus Saccharimonadales bacterium]